MPVFHGMVLQNSWCSFKANFILIHCARYSVQSSIFSILSTTTFVALAAPCEFQGRCLSRLTMAGTILQVVFERSDGSVENQS